VICLGSSSKIFGVNISTIIAGAVMYYLFFGSPFDGEGPLGGFLGNPSVSNGTYDPEQEELIINKTTEEENVFIPIQFNDSVLNETIDSQNVLPDILYNSSIDSLDTDLDMGDLLTI